MCWTGSRPAAYQRGRRAEDFAAPGETASSCEWPAEPRQDRTHTAIRNGNGKPNTSHAIDTGRAWPPAGPLARRANITAAVTGGISLRSCSGRWIVPPHSRHANLRYSRSGHAQTQARIRRSPSADRAGGDSGTPPLSRRPGARICRDPVASCFPAATLAPCFGGPRPARRVRRCGPVWHSRRWSVLSAPRGNRPGGQVRASRPPRSAET